MTLQIFRDALRPRTTVGCRVLLGLLCWAVVLSGCSDGGGEPEKNGRSGKKAATIITSELCTTQDVPVLIEAIGRVEASASVEIKSHINGTVEKVHFREGQAVRQGDPLFSIDSAPFHAQVRAKEAQLAQDRAELDNARQERDRYLPAAKSGFVSQEQADQATTRVASLEAKTAADEAALESARLDLNYCSIDAPIDGFVGELLVDAGNLVKANADNGMVIINRVSPIKVAFDIPGGRLAELHQAMQAGQLEATVTLPNPARERVSGMLAFIDNRIDPASGTLLVKAEFSNEDRKLWPGQLVPVALVLSIRAQVPVVPSRAVQVDQDGAHVFVVQADTTAQYRKVKIGPVIDGRTVIEEGVNPGDRVVTDGHLQLVDGALTDDRSIQPVDGTGKPRSSKK